MILASLIELWSSAWPAGLVMFGIGSAFAIVLLIASIKLKVEQDPKVEQVEQALPGLDCGACGYAGCASYAKAVVANPDLIGLCAPGGQEAAEQIASVLNLQISDSGPSKRPIVHCRAHTDDKQYFAVYSGLETCTAADAMPNVQACKFGCLGYGDCTRACRFDAIGIVDGLATVDYEKCTGCGACSRTCPRGLIEMVPFSSENMMVVVCKSRENTKTTRQFCKVGCIGCGLCMKQSELFEVNDNLARVDYGHYKPDEKVEKAMEKCPTGVIVYRGKNAPADRPAGKKPAAKKS